MTKQWNKNRINEKDVYEVPNSRGDVGLGQFLDQFSSGIDSEDPVQWNSHLFIGEHILSHHRTESLASQTQVDKERERVRVCVFTVALLPKAA